MRLLVANRAEVAVRIMRTAADLDIETVAVFSEDDRDALHTRVAAAKVALPGRGPAAYLDGARVIDAAHALHCDAIHPGYGLLSEDAAFAAAVEKAGLCFVGPRSSTLAEWGDKHRALARAESLQVPVLPRTGLLDDVAPAAGLMAEFGSVVLKAVAGGGGRGLRIVEDVAELATALIACREEARRSFASDAVYAERYLRPARHIEVQVLGDGATVRSLGTRDCSLQRRRQKVVEVAPAILPAPVLHSMESAAVRMAEQEGFLGLGTFEFLVSPSHDLYFIECNPRLQVEHTVTEAVTGLDLVALQLYIAQGATLEQLGLSTPPSARGWAMQLRIYAESYDEQGRIQPAGGELREFSEPSGPGVRVDSAVVLGQSINPRFDSLLAKLIVHAPDASSGLRRARRALREFHIDGLATNQGYLNALLARPEIEDWTVFTDLIDGLPLVASKRTDQRAAHAAVPDERGTLQAPLRAEVVAVGAVSGQAVEAGAELVVLEAMKMHHVVAAPTALTVDEVLVSVGDVVERGRLLLRFTPSGDATDIKAAAAPVDLDAVRQDLRELRARLEMTLDAQRPVAVARRHARGLRTARENVYDLCDSDSFQEYGQLIVAAQRRVKTLDELQHTTPADGLVAGFGTVNAELFGPLKTRCAVLAYDYTVLAGTQGLFNHKKTDRVLSVAHRQALPVIFFCEGGGGRPSDTDFQDIVASTLDVHTFATYAASSGQAPRIGIASGPCFAGNAVLFGSSDITIATRSANIGMAGPAMVTAGGLGACRTQDIGPIDVQAVNGVVDLVAADEAEAVELARRALSFFQGVASNWTVTDQRMLRHAVPEDRKRAYDVRPIIDVIFDENSFLELRRDYGPGMITGFARLEGRPVGLYANDPRHLGGAIDADGAQKAARFMLLCDAFGLPLVSLCDTPGFMVGPAHEREASVRRSSRMLVVAASLSVPTVMVCLRKGYGLGAQAMAGGSFCSPMLNVAWPTGEFGPMGLEGAVQLGFRKQLAAAPNAAAQKALFEREVGRLYEVGKALSTASMMEIDAVIDPADTRPTLVRALASFVPQPRRSRFVDVW